MGRLESGGEEPRAFWYNSEDKGGEIKYLERRTGRENICRQSPKNIIKAGKIKWLMIFQEQGKEQL